MGSKFTRRRFLTAVGASATCLALANTLGCEQAKRILKTGATTTSQPAQPEGAVTYGSPPSSQRGVWAFRSRLDLSPPPVEVAKEARDDIAPGYIFVAPKKGDAGQGGSMILDNDGQPVWLRLLQNEDMDVMNFRAQTYKGETVLTWWEGYHTGYGQGEYVIFDSSYSELARFKAANGYEGDHHEFLITPQDTALITIYYKLPRDRTSGGDPVDGASLMDGIVQELDIETGEVLFEWHSLDHVGFDESYTKLFDYFHINSIDVFDEDHLLISSRSTCTVYKVDRKTGEVLWRLGGKKSDFEMGPGSRFAWQHDARRAPDGTITILDNAHTKAGPARARRLTDRPGAERSRAIALRLDQERRVPPLERGGAEPRGLLADAQASTHALPNGNLFVGWGSLRFFSEFDRRGRLVFDGRMAAPNDSYRAYRARWRGRPRTRPAVAAIAAGRGRLEVAAS